MTEQHPNAPARPSPGRSRRSSRSSRTRPGVGHVCEPHTERFTVVGNALAQHSELSLTAIGLAIHIQSLPDGTPVSIKALAAKFPEGETRIAAALRELEAHGYLARIKERLPSGQIVTRTISYNLPQGAGASERSERPQAPMPRLELAPQPEEPEESDAPGEPEPPAYEAPDNPAPKQTEPPQPTGSRHRTAAADLLSGLRALSPRLLLAERDVRRLVPAAVAWLERGVIPADVQRVLATDLPPEPLRHPAAFLAHRLTALLPPVVPPAPRATRPDPLQTCEGCDRAFRSPEPGQCRACSHSGATAA
ncbi:helix-turn-helix domain-containing protein [Streptomyces sp. NPDC058257]|uniref:helix-turn-helix domain-containing protein n=1 Tax=Streptomyces sp. NPDC058257 TaxID=3346409 RepID=UPI0036E30C35